MSPQSCLTSVFSLRISVSWHFSSCGDSSFLVWPQDWMGLIASSSCANQQNIIYILKFSSPRKKREKQVGPKWETDGRKIVSTSFCSLFPSPPTGPDKKHKRIGESEKSLINSGQRRIGLHRCSHIYFSLLWFLLEMVQSWVCRAGSLGKVLFCPILLLWCVVI